MHSPRKEFWAALALFVTGVAFAVLAAWSMVARSTIPAALDGTVTGIELRHEKHPGVDDVWMVSIDDSDLRHFDHDVVARLSVGSRVHKDRWETELVIDGQTHDLELSEDARRMLILTPAMSAAFAVLLGASSWPQRRPREVSRTSITKRPWA